MTIDISFTFACTFYMLHRFFINVAKSLKLAKNHSVVINKKMYRKRK